VNVGRAMRKESGEYARKKGHQIKKDGVADRLLNLGSRVGDLALSAAAYELYVIAPYPFSAIIFLYWQRGVTLVVFLVIPAIIAMWATYHALGNRNYFASKPSAFKDCSIAEGPSDDISDDSDVDVSEQSESEPLQNGGRQRYQPSQSQITVVQGDATAGKRNRRNV
jgi:hypothetical protein